MKSYSIATVGKTEIAYFTNAARGSSAEKKRFFSRAARNKPFISSWPFFLIAVDSYLRKNRAIRDFSRLRSSASPRYLLFPRTTKVAWTLTKFEWYLLLGGAACLHIRNTRWANPLGVSLCKGAQSSIVVKVSECRIDAETSQTVTSVRNQGTC